MAIELLDLLKEYYKHIQHTEKERNQYLQILIGLSGAGILGAEKFLNDDPWIKIVYYFFMMTISFFSFNIMKKNRIVVECYTCKINDMLEHTKYNVLDCISKKEVSKSKQYECFSISLFLLNGVLGFYHLLNNQYVPYVDLLMVLLLGFCLGFILCYCCQETNKEQKKRVDAETKELEEKKPVFWKRVFQWWILGGFFAVQNSLGKLLEQATSLHNFDGVVLFIGISFIFAVFMSFVERYSPELRGIANEILGSQK